MRSLQSGWMVGCLLLALSASDSFGAFNYWDPQGKGTGGPTSGIWETSSWSISSSGSAPPVAWSESLPALFAFGTSVSTPPFTVTMNSSHTVAGIFNGNSKPACSVTINGSGTMIMPASSQQGFYVASPGITTVDVPISGSGAQLIPENTGELDLYGVNTYTGGTQLGFSSGASSFIGTLGFNNSASFGTGPISFAF